MTSFPFNNSDGEKCPLCKADDNKDAILLAIAGTRTGNRAQAIQVHVACLLEQLWYYPGSKAIIAVPK